MCSVLSLLLLLLLLILSLCCVISKKPLCPNYASNFFLLPTGLSQKWAKWLPPRLIPPAPVISSAGPERPVHLKSLKPPEISCLTCSQEVVMFAHTRPLRPLHEDAVVQHLMTTSLFWCRSEVGRAQEEFPRVHVEFTSCLGKTDLSMMQHCLLNKPTNSFIGVSAPTLG